MGPGNKKLRETRQRFLIWYRWIAVAEKNDIGLGIKAVSNPAYPITSLETPQSPKATFVLSPPFQSFVFCSSFSFPPLHSFSRRTHIWKMPPVRTSRNRKPPPAGFDDIEDTLLEFSNKMKDAENAPHEGKKKHEVLWPIFQISHQRESAAL